MTYRQKIFISYHEADQDYKDQLEGMLVGNYEVLSSQSFDSGLFSGSSDIDQLNAIRKAYLEDSILTIVLVGQVSAFHKNIDWEIASSLSQTYFCKRSGLMGIRLPFEQGNCNRVPVRLKDNISNGYAALYQWNNDWFFLEQWIKRAMKTRHKNADNHRKLPTISEMAA